MSSAPWAKIWWAWYSSRSHIGLSGVALALGAPLMLICRAAAGRHSDGHSDAKCDGQRDGQGDVTPDLVWVRDKAGRPITAAKIAAIARFPIADVESALAELVDAETLVLSADGVYGFPNFWRYQESAAAARTRKYRGQKKRHSDGHSDAKCDGPCDDKRKEVRGKRLEDPLATQEVGASAPASGLVGLVAQVVEKPASRGDIARAALSAAVKALAAEHGHEAPPTASRAHMAAGASKVAALVKAGSQPAQAGARVARAAYRLLATGKASSFGWALNDCVIGAAAEAPTPSRSGRVAPSAGTTGKDFEDEEDLSVQMARWNHG